jgi:hypothetical protein
MKHTGMLNVSILITTFNLATAEIIHKCCNWTDKRLLESNLLFFILVQFK